MKGIITGGTRGLGLNLAEEMAKEGYTDLILTYNSNDEAAQKAKTNLEKDYNVRVSVLKGDIGQESTIDEIFKCAEEKFGKLNAFVHNAGSVIGVTSSAETDDAKKAAQSYNDKIGLGAFNNFSTYDYYQNIYPKCFIRCVEQAVKMMEDGKGYIIAVSTYGSNVLQTPKPGYAITAQAKGCMELLVSFSMKYH